MVWHDDNQHFLLHCPLFESAERDFIFHFGDIPVLNFSVLENDALMGLLLFCDEKLNIASDSLILKATISFIKRTMWLH